MTKELGRRSSGIQIGKIDIKRRDGRWTNSGNKVLKKKKKRAKCNRARRKGAERRKMLPGAVAWGGRWLARQR